MRNFNKEHLDSSISFLKSVREGRDFISGKEGFVLNDEQIARLQLAIKLLTNLAKKNIDIFEETGLNFRPNQIRTIRQLTSFIANLGSGEMQGYFQQPTGAGKTILFGMIARMLDVRTLILVPRSVLLEQTKQSFIDQLGFTEDQIGLVGDGTSDFDKPFVISTYQSHISNMNKKNGYQAKMDSIELVICDEGHKALGDKTQEAMEIFDYTNEIFSEEESKAHDEFEKGVDKYISRRALRLGFTATPELGCKHVDNHFNTLIGKVTYREMIEAGFLVPLEMYQVDVFFNENEGTKDHLSKEEATAILEREAVYDRLLQSYSEVYIGKLADKELKTVVFCTNVQECLKFQHVAEEKYGYRTMVITSRVGAGQLEEAEQKLITGEIDMIISVDQLTEGYDNPDINSIILARPNGSPARIIQAVGRGMRSKKGKERCYVFEGNWSIRNANVNVNDDLEVASRGISNESTTKQLYVKNGLTVTQALLNLQESVNGVCYSGQTDRELTYVQICELDETGQSIVTIDVDGVATELLVTNLGNSAASFFGVSFSFLNKRVQLAGLPAVKGIQGKKSSWIGPVYRLQDVEKVLFEGVCELDENGQGVITIDETEVKVTNLGRNAATFFRCSDTTLRNKVQDADLQPLPGTEGRSGSWFGEVYPYEQVKALFPKVICELDENGQGVVTIDQTEVKVTNLGKRAAKKLGLSWGKLKKEIEKASLPPLSNIAGKCQAWFGAVYDLKEVERVLFEGVCYLDSYGRGLVKVTVEGITREVVVTNLGNKAAKLFRIKPETLKGLVKRLGLQPVAGIEGRLGSWKGKVYVLEEVEKLLETYFAN